MKRILPVLLIAALCLCSCSDAWDILYKGRMFGTMQSAGVMLGDDGCTYHFTNMSQWGEEVPVSGRIVALFDVYKHIEGTEKDYEAKLLSFAPPLCKEPVECEDDEEQEALGDDSIKILDGFWSGGHLNLTCSVMLRPTFADQHHINLQIVSGESADTLHTILRHNAGEDPYSDDDSESFVDYSFYASFPLANKVSETGAKFLELRWQWDDEWQVVYADLRK